MGLPRAGVIYSTFPWGLSTAWAGSGWSADGNVQEWLWMKDKPKDKPSASKPKPKPAAGPRVSLPFWPVWIGCAILVAVGFAFAAKMTRFPMDAEVARWLQNLDRSQHTWAKVLTDGAKEPWVYGWLGLAVVLGWRAVSWRMILVVPAAYGLVLALDHWLKPLLARPRPGGFGLRIFGSLTGYSCPSTFALTFAVTVGTLFWVYLKYQSGRERWVGAGVAFCLLVAGGAARVVLGAHWPSDVLLSYAAGALIVAALMKVIVRK
jgi:undecaprenyl-diphosphatase